MSEIISKTSLLVGLTGGKGTGKDTIAEHLVSFYGFDSLAFADPVRAAAAAAFDVPISTFTDVRTKETPMAALCGRSPRHVLQTLGTEWGRNLIRSDIWVLRMQHALTIRNYRGCMRTVVTDVRFDEEAEMLRKMGGEIWLVTRPQTEYSTGDTHASERGVSEALVTRVIQNNMDKKTLYTQTGVALSNAEKDALRRPNDSTTV